MTKIAKSEFRRDEVATILNTVLKKIEKPAPHDIAADIRALNEIIQKVRAELAQARPQDINGTFIPTATDELDEVVEETATATDAIMDTCDAMQAIDMPEPYKTQIADHVTKIYEACSFQDITGQRIRKVVRTLKDIEDKINNMIATLGPAVVSAEAGADTRTGDDALLNGPQMSGQGVSQDEIDKLLASFD